MKNRGNLIIISGFSGSGKSTIVNNLIKKYNQYILSISCTTRKIRIGEVDGKSYFFISVEKFEEMIKNNEFLEYAKYIDNYYGTPKFFVEENLNKGFDVILEIEIQGAMIVKNKYPNSKLIFVSTKDADTLINRLNQRGSNSKDEIKKRIRRSIDEAKEVKKYDYLLINENLEEAINKLNDIINNDDKKNKYNNNFNIIKNIQIELEKKIND
ncbi:MAG: guanylate kinase [Eubacteriales bacterium]|nr:guanylate kinase [Eubacteriales bacterium]